MLGSGRFAGEVKSGDFLVRLRRAGCMEDMVSTRLEIATCPPFPFHGSVILACSVLRVEAVSTRLVRLVTTCIFGFLNGVPFNLGVPSNSSFILAMTILTQALFRVRYSADSLAERCKWNLIIALSMLLFLNLHTWVGDPDALVPS